MNIALTGASGFLGYHLIEALIKEGHHVTAIALDAEECPALKKFDIEKYNIDVRDEESHRRVFQNKDVVYHLASKIDITNKCTNEIFSINVDGTKAVAQAALDAGVQRFIYTSSIHALSREPLEELIDESRSFAIKDPFDYDRSKAHAELAVNEFTKRGLNTVIANLTGLWGPQDFIPSQMGLSLFYFMREKYVIFTCNGGFNFLDVRDAAKTLVNMIDKGKSGERYILGGQWYLANEMARAANEAAGHRAKICSLPLNLLKSTLPISKLIWKLQGKKYLYTEQSLVHLCSHQFVSDQKARDELNHQTRSISETMKDLYDWSMSDQSVNIPL